MVTLFICTSITHKLGKPAEIAKLRGIVETIDRTAEQRGAITRCAFREEHWKGEEDPAVYVPRDIQWARECDGAILIPESSYGVRIELGWLSLLQKPVLRLYADAVAHRSAIEQHLHHATRVFDRVFHNMEDVAPHVHAFIDFLESIR